MNHSTNAEPEIISIENEKISVSVIPSLGAKISSLLFKPESFQCAYQTRFPLRHRQVGDDFSNYDASGYDDCFPTVDAESITLNGKEVIYPDHGEIWTLPFFTESSDNEVYLTAEGINLPYLYKKSLHLERDCVSIEWEITNTGDFRFPYLWLFHGLVPYREDMELVYPQGTNQFLNVLDSNELGEAGTLYTTNEYPFGQVPSSSGSMLKYYVFGKVSEGYFGYRYPTENVELTATYDKNKLPYLGFWITTGGYRGEKNCAFEPATGFYDSINRSISNNAITYLECGETVNFSLRLSLKSMY